MIIRIYLLEVPQDFYLNSNNNGISEWNIIHLERMIPMVIGLIIEIPLENMLFQVRMKLQKSTTKEIYVDNISTQSSRFKFIILNTYDKTSFGS